MKKYLVDVCLPASGQHFDTFLPATKRISEVTELLVQMAESLSGGSYIGTADSMLFNADDGEPFEQASTVYEAGIRNASRLIIM